MKTLTPEQIIALGPCEGYNLQQVTELFGNKESVTYLEILDTNKIPLRDIVWLFCQLTVLDNDIKKQWLEVIVTRAVTNYALHCGVDTVEKWAKDWLNNKDRTAESANSAVKAGYTAYAAVNAASAANDFATCHAAYAARAAYAFIAACTAACAAACAAGYVAARDVEYKQQIQDLKDILQGKKQ